LDADAPPFGGVVENAVTKIRRTSATTYIHGDRINEPSPRSSYLEPPPEESFTGSSEAVTECDDFLRLMGKLLQIVRTYVHSIKVVAPAGLSERSGKETLSSIQFKTAKRENSKNVALEPRRENDIITVNQ